MTLEGATLRVSVALWRAKLLDCVKSNATGYCHTVAGDAAGHRGGRRCETLCVALRATLLDTVKVNAVEPCGRQRCGTRLGATM